MSGVDRGSNPEWLSRRNTTAPGCPELMPGVVASLGPLANTPSPPTHPRPGASMVPAGMSSAGRSGGHRSRSIYQVEPSLRGVLNPLATGSPKIMHPRIWSMAASCVSSSVRNVEIGMAGSR